MNDQKNQTSDDAKPSLLVVNGGASTPSYQPLIDEAMSAIANNASDEEFARCLSKIDKSKRAPGLKVVD
jgi:hypothetical protein